MEATIKLTLTSTGTAIKIDVDQIKWIRPVKKEFKAGSTYLLLIGRPYEPIIVDEEYNKVVTECMYIQKITQKR